MTGPRGLFGSRIAAVIALRLLMGFLLAMFCIDENSVSDRFAQFHQLSTKPDTRQGLVDRLKSDITSLTMKNAELELEGIAINRELIVALANNKVRIKLDIWLANIKRVGICNHLVVALDDSTAEFCESNGVSRYKPDLDQRMLHSL